MWHASSIFGRHDSDEYLYLALELCHGTLESLAEMARRAQRGERPAKTDLPGLRGDAVGKQMARGLAHLHGVHVCAGDVAAPTILLDADARARL